MPSLPVVSSRAPRAKMSSRCGLGDAGAVVLDQDLGESVGGGLDRHEHAAAAIFGGILDQVAEHFVEVLALDADFDGLVAGKVDGDLAVKRVDRALDRLGAFPHDDARLDRGAAADGAGAGEVMVDLAAHGRCLAADRVGEVGGVGGGGVGDHRERGLERMGKVAGVAPRFLGLGFAMRQQLVDLVDQRD